MSELEEKLGAVLNNPQLMHQIISIAQSLGNPPPKKEDTQIVSQAPPAQPSLDPKMIQSIAAITKQNGVDSNQQALLTALSPYLHQDRVAKLERAMRAARMAGAASSFLSAGGMQLFSRR